MPEQPRPIRPIRRITPHVACVLLLLLADPKRGSYGAEVARRLRCQQSTVMRIFEQLYWAGWVTFHKSTGHGGPPRYYYRLSEGGIVEARTALDREYGTSPALVLLTNSLGLPFDGPER